MNNNQINNILSKYKIQTWINNIILRKKSDNVNLFDDNLLEFCEEMKIMMIERDWIWLAAPQIWVNKNIICITVVKWVGRRIKPIWEKILINPVIVSSSKKFEVDEEWCLSLPGQYAKVKRPIEVKVKYFDEYWNSKIEIFNWYNSRIVQHEIDHLNWVLFVDRSEDKLKSVLWAVIKI